MSMGMTASLDERAGVLIAVSVALLTAAPAHAYIDPSTPGFIAQILSPIVIAFGLFWRQIKLRLSVLFMRNKKPDTSGNTENHPDGIDQAPPQ